MFIMKKIQNSVVSVLILSFVFLAMHDFAMLEIDSSPHYNSYNSSFANLSEGSELDIIDDVHENIHSLFAISRQSAPSVVDALVAFQANHAISGISSNNDCVLERPPLG